MIISKNIQHALFYLLMMACALYIEVPIIGKPYFLLMSFVVPSALICFIFSKKVSVDILILIILSIALFVLSVVKMALSQEPFAHLYVLNVLIFPVALILGTNLSLQTLNKVIKHFCYISVGVFLIEAFYRFNNPYFGGKIVDPNNIENSTFYIYKMSSLMYTNSNGIGMHVIFMLAFLLFYKLVVSRHLAVTQNDTELSGHVVNQDKDKIPGRIWFALIITSLAIVNILSLSRTSIALLPIITVLYILLRNYTAGVINILVLLVLALSILFYFVIEGYFVALTDGSLLTKFEILNNLISYLQQASVRELLLGNALDNPNLIYPDFEGTVGHTHYFDLVFRLGLVPSLVYGFLVLLALKKAGWPALIFVIMFVLLGFSNIRIYGHYFFLFLALMLVVANSVANDKGRRAN